MYALKHNISQRQNIAQALPNWPGLAMPTVGLGTWKSPRGQTGKAVEAAIRAHAAFSFSQPFHQFKSPFEQSDAETAKEQTFSRIRYGDRFGVPLDRLRQRLRQRGARAGAVAYLSVVVRSCLFSFATRRESHDESQAEIGETLAKLFAEGVVTRDELFIQAKLPHAASERASERERELRERERKRSSKSAASLLGGTRTTVPSTCARTSRRL